MQKLLLISLFVFATFSNSFGQKNPTKLSGTVNIDEVSSMDATEVTIMEWIYFIINNDFNSDFFPDLSKVSNSTRLIFEDLKKQKDFEYFKIKNKSHNRKEWGEKTFETTKNFKLLTDSDTNYFSINIPIVGISFSQAIKFCKWRETIVNESKKIKVSVGLPTVEVYKRVIENKDTINIKKCYLQNSLNCNCLEVRKTKDYKSQGKCLLRADSYWPSMLGLYCLQGNASEMTNVEGISMGGSFRDYASQSFKDKTQNYTNAEDWLGFRCLITMK